MSDQTLDINSTIVLCFFSISKNKLSFKISKKEIEYFKDKIFNLMNQSCGIIKLTIYIFFIKKIIQPFDYLDLSSFCSFCSSATDLENTYECQCKRKYHKFCLDERYIKLYKYSNFECYFCRNNYIF